MTTEARQGLPITIDDLRGEPAEFDDLISGFITAERIHPDNIDIQTHAQMAAFVHEVFGFSTAGSTTSYSEQGNLTGQSARRVETLVTQSKDFGNRELLHATEELFALASFLKRRYPERPGESSKARLRRAFLEITNGNDNNRSIRDMLKADQRREALGLIARSEIFEQNNHFDE